MGQIARLKIVAAALDDVGQIYVFGGGHGPKPGATTIDGRTGVDCSGEARRRWYGVSGNDKLNGTSETQFAGALGGHIAVPKILPGMLAFFAGSDGTVSAPGHVGIVTAYNPATRQGSYLSAYDTAEGILVEPFVAGSPGWAGATDPCSTLPDPIPTAAQLKAAKLVGLPNVAAASKAKANGHPLYYFLGKPGGFVVQVAGNPTGVELFASVNWQTKA